MEGKIYTKDEAITIICLIMLADNGDNDIEKMEKAIKANPEAIISFYVSGNAAVVCVVDSECEATWSMKYYHNEIIEGQSDGTVTVHPEEFFEFLEATESLKKAVAQEFEKRMREAAKRVIDAFGEHYDS